MIRLPMLQCVGRLSSQYVAERQEIELSKFHSRTTKFDTNKPLYRCRIMSTVVKAVKSYCSNPQIAKPGSSPYSNAYKNKKIFEINGSAII